MIRYEILKDKPKRFLSLTGYTLEEFSALLPSFSKRFLAFVGTQTLDRKHRKKRRYTLYKNSCLPSHEDQLLFILIYLRKAMTQDVLGELFGMSQPVANKWIHRKPLPVLNSALADLEALPSPEAVASTVDASPQASTDRQDSSLFFHDGTERPIQRPKDREAQQVYYSGKKKQHTVKNNLLINADSKVLLLTPSYEGRIHDKRIADMTVYFLPEGSCLYQDSGFQGFSVAGVKMIQPMKKPKSRDLTDQEKAKNREISSIRIRIEHAMSGIKRYRIVKDKLRTSKKGFAD